MKIALRKLLWLLPLIACDKQADKMGYSHVNINFKASVEIRSDKTDGSVSAIVTLPPGLGGIGTLNISEGMSIANDANSLSLDIASGTKAAGASINVAAAKLLTDAQVGQLQLSVPAHQGATLNLVNNDRIVVFYIVKMYDGSVKLGVIPTPLLRFKDGLVSFNMIGMGNYQAAIVSVPVSQAVEIVTTLPVFTKAQEMALPKLVLGPVRNSIDLASRVVTVFRTASFDMRQLVQCQAVLDEDRGGGAWDHLAVITDRRMLDSGSISHAFGIVKDEAHTLFARLTCVDQFGRHFDSDWSAAIQIPLRYNAIETPSSIEEMPDFPVMRDFQLVTERTYYQTKSIIRIVATDNAYSPEAASVHLQINALPFEFSWLNDYSNLLVFGPHAVYLQPATARGAQIFRYGDNSVEVAILGTAESNKSQFSFTLRDFTLFVSSGVAAGTSNNFMSSNDAISGRVSTSDGYSVSSGLIDMISY